MELKPMVSNLHPAHMPEEGSPLVTVVVPVYNAGRFLKMCLDSVLGQTLANFEVICINDGSTDESLSILDRYRDQDERIVVLSLERSNAGRARNAALDIARGKFLAFLDADDYFESTMLEEMVAIMELENLDVALCKSRVLDDATGDLANREIPVLDTLQAGEVYAAKDLWGKAFRYAVGWPWDKVFRRAFIEDHGLRFQEIQSTNDAFFVYTALALANRIAFIESRLVVHRVGNPASIENVRHKTWRNLFLAIDAIRERLEAEGLLAQAQRDLDNWIAEMCIWNIWTLHDEADEFYDYVKDAYAMRLASLSEDYFYSEDFRSLFEVWAHCDCSALKRFYERVLDIERVTLERDRILAEKRENEWEAERKLREAHDNLRGASARFDWIEQSRSYRIGRAITKPVRIAKGLFAHSD